MTSPSELPHSLPHPTDQDRENARICREITERFQCEYDACSQLAEQAFGPGWLPSHRHYLLDKHEEDRCRRTRERPTPASTVFTVKNPAGEPRHFMIVGASPVECESMEAGFGPMLLEPRPTRTIAVRDQHVHPHRYSLCWSAYERHEPRPAEQLPQLRANRERRRQERQQLRWAEENPLLAWAERERQDDLPAEEEGGGR